MKLQLSVPSKTFLMGEYLALEGGPALLLNTAPRFELIASYEKSPQQIYYKNEVATPAAKYLNKYANFFQNFSLQFRNPHNDLGGFGASSAEFCLLAALKNYFLKEKLDLMELLKEYQTLAWGGKGFAPSGADVIAQLFGGITYFNKNQNIVEKLVWPFTHLAFGLIHTQNKIDTYQHIEKLSVLNIDGLEEVVQSGIAGIKNYNVKEFCAAINRYAAILLEKKLISPKTTELLKLIRSNKDVLAAKGCGALGADVIFVLFDKKNKKEFLEWNNLYKLNLILIDDHAKEGLTIENLENSNKHPVILVDQDDWQIGIGEKKLVHQQALLHRAFSVFIFRKKHNSIEVLLQQRAKDKYHSGCLWSNTCCSHPKPGEDILKNATERLQQEMGVTTTLYEIGSFRYFAKLSGGMTEHEVDHVFVGVCAQDNFNPDQSEIQNYRWIKLLALQKDLVKNAENYTPWLQQALNLILTSGTLRYLFNKSISREKNE